MFLLSDLMMNFDINDLDIDNLYIINLDMYDFIMDDMENLDI